ncbi:hypothetical protein D3C78_1518350 [compost metagenome]
MRLPASGRHYLFHPQLLQLVTQRAEGDAQLRGSAGLVPAVFFQRALDGTALELFDIRGQGGTARVQIDYGFSVRSAAR